MLHQIRRPWPPPSATLASFLVPLFLLISILVSFLPPSSCDPDEDTSTQYNKCRKRIFSCGNRTIEVSYPFYEHKSPSYCGYPGFEVRCDNETISIAVEDQRYYLAVQGIDYDNHSLTLVDHSSIGESCGWSNRPTPNFSLDPLFNYSDLGVNVTIWECSNPISQLLNFNYSCFNDDANSHHKYYYWPNSSIPGDVLGHEETCPTTWNVWMDKLAVERMIAGSISYEEALHMGFTVTWTPEVWQNCSDCIGSGGVCGSLQSFNRSQVCFCRSFQTGLHGSCPSYREDKPGREHNSNAPDSSPAVYLALVVMAAAFSVPMLSICAAIGFLCQKNKNKSGRITPNIKAFLDDHGSLAPKAYKYSNLKKITKSFNDKLGQGGYGSVYRGQIPDGRVVAVKILEKSKESGADFINEVASIGRTSHVNIVSLLGFCLDGRRRALVYEFMPNGSLDKYIYSDQPKALLPWDKLYQIAIGIAHGLEYLHRGCSTCIVHFDIKPHNILLDEDFHPKISDFGLAKLCPHRESKLSVADARGTIGFIAPEVFSRYFGEVSTKSDVYSYGMMVLEMVGGRRNVKACDRTSEVYFPHWVYEHLDRDEDLRPYHVAPETEGIARRMIIVGLWCIQPEPAKRPSMSKVVMMLEGTAGDLKMPAKPFISSPARSPAVPCVQSTVDSSFD